MVSDVVVVVRDAPATTYTYALDWIKYTQGTACIIVTVLKVTVQVGYGFLLQYISFYMLYISLYILFKDRQ